MPDETPPPSDQKPRPKISVEIIKSQFHRTVHVDGAWGGPYQDLLTMSLYSERSAIPQRMVYEATEHGFGNEIAADRITRSTLVREVEVTAIMDLPTAKSLHEWLGRMIGTLERALTAALARQATEQQSK